MTPELLVIVGYAIGVMLTIAWQHRHTSPSFAPNDYGEGDRPISFERYRGAAAALAAGREWISHVDPRTRVFTISKALAPEAVMLHANNRRRKG